ncbi:MAG: hypothetical protein IIW40_02370 [Clostridia bacterium]|nr:hypothetical protein [Clostridia bacterium]
MKQWSNIFFALAAVLSNIMCAVVAYNYAALSYAGQAIFTSAPAYVAFFLAIPYALGIAVCILVAIILRKRSCKK